MNRRWRPRLGCEDSFVTKVYQAVRRRHASFIREQSRPGVGGHRTLRRRQRDEAGSMVARTKDVSFELEPEVFLCAHVLHTDPLYAGCGTPTTDEAHGV